RNRDLSNQCKGAARDGRRGQRTADHPPGWNVDHGDGSGGSPVKRTTAGAYFMTRRFAFRALSAGAVAVILAAPGWAGVFGKVVPIGGNASDIALDEARHSLYIANFTANRIEVMSTDDLTISRSINVNPQPGSMALSPDGKYLVIGHYNNVAAP